MSDGIVGTRIRQRRRDLKVSQADLARDIGISASYLNLIEWNKRRVTDDVLARVAESLGLDVEQLDGASERRLAEELSEISHLRSLAALGVEQERCGELIGRFPGWARSIAALVRSERDATTRANRFSDRLANDPFLSETVHRMLTNIAAVRSAAEILSTYDDIDVAQTRQFLDIVNDESLSLSEVGEALARYLDADDQTDPVLTPIDEVENLFESNNNHFAAIEKLCAGRGLIDASDRAVARKEIAMEIYDNLLDEPVGQWIDQQEGLSTARARQRGRSMLREYSINALLMPRDLFAERAMSLNFDVEALASAFGVDVEAVCRRLTARFPADDQPRFGYLKANASGSIVSMLGLPGLTVPRYAPACPLWALYRAQQSPETVIRQHVVFPSGSRFVFVARAHLVGKTGFGQPRHYLTDMLVMSGEDAVHTVYAPDRAALLEEVGPSCRLCPRHTCDHRVEDPLAG